MNRELSTEAVQLGALVRERIQAAGGVDVLRRAVESPQTRADIGAMLDELGVWDVDPRDGAFELEVAAEVCRVAGAFALPYPVAERLAAGPGGGIRILVSEEAPRIAAHLDLGLEVTATTLGGNRCTVELSTASGPLASPLAPFGCELVDVDVHDDREPRATAILVTLQAWWLLGLLEVTLADTLRYAQEREQFGRPLVKFQAVAFRLADMSLEVEGLAELARYTLWALSQDAPDEEALLEALALRVAALRAADLVLQGGHQLHGAMGFTDEVDVSWLSKASQTVRRLPEDRARTVGRLTSLVEAHGYPKLG